MEWAPRIRTGFHVSRPTWDTATGLETSRTGLSPSAAGLSRPLRSNLIPLMPSRNPAGQARRFGLLRVRSPLLAESLLISSPRGTEMFHFPPVSPPAPIGFRAGWCGTTRTGLLHSETHGSKFACNSPWTIAACRVLHRLPSPRHPSCARTACPQILFYLQGKRFAL